MTNELCIDTLSNHAIQAISTHGGTIDLECSFVIRSSLLYTTGDPNARKGGVGAERYIESLEGYLRTILPHSSIIIGPLYVILI
jgi:hypothetical protein